MPIGGGLGLAVEGPSKALLECKDNGDGSCGVAYFPTLPGEYKVIVKYADQDIKGSPFTAKITPASEFLAEEGLFLVVSLDCHLLLNKIKMFIESVSIKKIYDYHICMNILYIRKK